MTWPLARLKLLRFWMFPQFVTSLSPLGGHQNLNCLLIRDNKLKSLGGLSNLPKLTELYAGDNAELEDISALEGLKTLSTLNLSNTAVSDLKSLSKLTSLKTLVLENCNIEDLTPLFELKNLKELYLGGNPLSEEALLEIASKLPGCDVFN